MKTIKTWILTILILFAALSVFSYDDGLEDQQLSAQVNREAIAQAAKDKQQLKAEQIYFDHLLWGKYEQVK
jgi:hypothetical protein